MANREEDEDLIRNEDTLNRRAWVDRALESVRQRLDDEHRAPTERPRDKGAQLFVIPVRKSR
jgi:hypothetical protein